MTIKVKRKILHGLEAIRDSRSYNMFEIAYVLRWLEDNNYYETSEWILNNRTDYVSGVFEGFEVK